MSFDSRWKLPQGRNPDQFYTWAEGIVKELRAGDYKRLASYTVATVPPATPAGMLIYVSNEAGGAVPAFSDGTNWRRVTDRAIVS
jgi:hypothetical protein